MIFHVFCQAIEKNINRGAVSQCTWFRRVVQAAAAGEYQVIFASAHQGRTGFKPVSRFSQTHRQRCLFIEPGGKTGGKLLIDMLYDGYSNPGVGR